MPTPHPLHMYDDGQTDSAKFSASLLVGGFAPDYCLQAGYYTSLACTLTKIADSAEQNLSRSTLSQPPKKREGLV